MIEKTLKELGFSDNATAVYLKLIELGTASARQLAENIGMPRPSVYDYLSDLVDGGLVVEQDEYGKKLFQISDVANLKQLIKDKIETLKADSQELDRALPQVLAKGVEPKVRHFKGVEQVGKILNDLYWYENTEILGVWPMQEMLEVLGAEYLERFNRRRIKNNNHLRVIWPSDKVADIADNPFLGTGKGHLRDLRIAPLDMTWNMGHLIYKDKVVFVSSRQERFGFVVQSRDFAELMRAQFEVVWNISQPPGFKPPKEDKFIKSLERFA